FSFLAPCPSSGIIINGSTDQVAPHADVLKLVERLKTQKGITIEHSSVEGANHFFESHLEPRSAMVGAYLDKRLAAAPEKSCPLNAPKHARRGVIARRASVRARRSWSAG